MPQLFNKLNLDANNRETLVNVSYRRGGKGFDDEKINGFLDFTIFYKLFFLNLINPVISIAYFIQL